MIYGDERIIKVDPTNLKPGDIVVGLEDFEEDGCHCDVVVTVKRYEES